MKGAVVTIYPKRGHNDSRRDFSRPNSLPEERAGVVPRPVCDGVTPRRNISLLSYYPVSRLLLSHVNCGTWMRAHTHTNPGTREHMALHCTTIDTRSTHDTSPLGV